jgi:hypothetical protein
MIFVDPDFSGFPLRRVNIDFFDNVPRKSILSLKSLIQLLLP